MAWLNDEVFNSWVESWYWCVFLINAQGKYRLSNSGIMNERYDRCRDLAYLLWRLDVTIHQ